MQLTKLLSYLLISTFILVGCSDDDDSPINGNPDQIANNLPLGSGGTPNDLLSDTTFKSLTIEIVAVEGFEPTSIAIENFRTFLEDRLNKPDGITINLRTVPSSNTAPFTIEEIREIEKNTRTLFNEGDDIAVYVYFADGSNENDSGEQVTLGSAYKNTSMVIYEGTLRRFSRSGPRAPSLSTIETATLHHEFSHLLGLVDLGTPQQSPHESINDQNEGNNHCNVSGCLMQASIQFTSGIMGMSEVPRLDAACIADLQANGGK
ncbi:hypothetical protein J8281_08390 [Aquimarina sp. U1-2]|uniref:hypothetical protein n=1 Tax=Aquimarina sp. U1-2 TaxID=2823141 RepID=UPI001AECA2F2|nr:hypothetical protein [Aquimarina sp. U1-2]MBP2832206.1 hypothetical protein [Aquimarina sp. U1-2]